LSQGTVVVTGPSRGIGLATVRLLAERGCRCLLLGRPSERLEEALEQCRRLEPDQDHRTVACDLGDVAAIESAAERVLEVATPIALVNNVGIVERARLEEMTESSLRRQLDVNLVGPIWLTRALLPAMRAVGRGCIVNVSSISARLGTAGQIAYNASKWGLLGFTKSLAEELSDSGLSTVAVLPGTVDTEMGRGGKFPPRMTAEDVARTLVHHALDAPLAHNGGVIEMFGV